MLLNETSPLAAARSKNGRPRKKYLVLFSDGGNKLYWIRETESPENIRTDEENDALTIRMCNEIKQEGITLITVGFKIDQPGPDFDRAKAVLNACASSAELNFSASNAAELNAAFAVIGRQVLEQFIRLIE